MDAFLSIHQWQGNSGPVFDIVASSFPAARELEARNLMQLRLERRDDILAFLDRLPNKDRVSDALRKLDRGESVTIAGDLPDNLIMELEDWNKLRFKGRLR
jgi:hypothetical protein